MTEMQKLLLFLVENRYMAKIKGKNWECGIILMEGMEHTKRHFMLSYEVVLTPEMVKSVEIFPNRFAVITLVN